MIDLNVIWVVGCAGLVLLMQPGFMCLESGLTRSKNSINVATKNLADLGISICFFWIFGFAIMFGPSIGGWIGTAGFFLGIEDDSALAAFFIFQTMFCGTSTTIVSGALAERLRFQGYVAIAMVSSGLIYPLFGHWVWNGTNAGQLAGWLGQLGFVDFAGASVVHSVGGWVSLAALLVVGPRTGRFSTGSSSRRQSNKIHGSNLPFSVLGAMLLWVGWMGFNGGSTFALTEQVPAIIVHTILSGAAGMMSAGAFGWYQRRILQPETLINGSLAGLVSITASCHAVSTPMAVLIGATGGLVMLATTNVMEHYGIDDGVDAVALHGAAGLWGTLSVALFADMELLGTGLTRHQQLLAQVLGILVCFLWAFGLTYFLLKIINRILPFRVSVEDEEIGLNVSEHEAKTEVYELFRVMDQQAQTQDFSLRVPEDPFTEAGKIARRYNQVMASLERYANELENLNANLEEIVDQRTASLIKVNAELEQANRELARIDRVKDEFLANTSHELRTPLNGIIGLSEYLIEGEADSLSETVLMNMSMIANSGRRLYNLVNDILDFSNILQDNLSLHLTAVEPRAVTEIVLALCRPLVGRKDLQLVNSIASDLPLIPADENRIQQILYNLIGNAIKFTEKGKIEICSAIQMTEDIPKLVITVSDTGIGISEEEHGRIFESFEQAEGSTAREYSGLGLGLAVTKKLIELHGGTIWVNSVVGEGSQFGFALPVRSLEITAERRAPEGTPKIFEYANELQIKLQPKQQQTHQLETVETTLIDVTMTEGYSRVLIVDDDPVNLLVLNNYLGLHHYQVTQAASGQEAMALLAEGYTPDLVILDIMMPRMTGYEVTKAIRAKWSRDELPIVLLTAKNRLEDEVVGLQAGANDYLTKPIVKEGLLARIGTQISLRQESLSRQAAQAERLQVAEELAQKNIALMATQEALAQQNRTLEQQVAQRTAVLEENQRSLAILMQKSEAANLAKSKFLANMSHELRTPLNSIIGFAQLLNRDESLPHKHQQRSRIINRSAEHLLSLINNVLDISKIEAGKVVLNESSFSLSGLLQDVLDMFELSVARKQIELRLEQASDLPQFIFTDEGRLRQILTNLVGNAVKFTEKGQIVVSVGTETVAAERPTEPARSLIQFSIQDTGSGISEQELDTIFIPFEQAAAGRAAKKGTGLGLPISRQYSQLMGGDISVSSVLNEGSTFRLTLPLKGYEPLATVQPRLRDSKVARMPLASTDFEAMPHEWLQDLYWAANQLKGKRVLQLIKQIPPERASLASRLQEVAEDYQFQKIVEAVECVLDAQDTGAQDTGAQDADA